ncbi:class I SAM-dependent methyltransferase [bacterium]|nr:MAG: class I SAM-dependent methyltransferase [bacterium]
MASNDGKVLSEELIQDLNAHGPYSMAVWHSGDIRVGNEEGLSGREAYFTNLIRRTILKHFTVDQIKTFSILDIGCNDGWVLNELSDLPFARMVGIEPREKNIVKGQTVRNILQISNRVEYKLGDIESLGDESFDVVICAGVLYHVESIPVALRRIANICKAMVFIESRCISSKYITKALMNEIEMRDLVYQYKEKTCGITAQKFESAYHDGSTKSLSVVNIPTVESLVMQLDILGFQDVEIVADPKSYRRAVWKNRRALNGVCISAYPKLGQNSSVSDESIWIREYERGLEKTVLKRDFIEPLYEHYCHRKTTLALFSHSLITFMYLKSPSWLAGIFGSFLEVLHREKYELEIIKNLRYGPRDKLCLEYGKMLNSVGEHEFAMTVLKSVTTRINADWRSVYRSFHLLSAITSHVGLLDESCRYQTLCVSCNPRFPVEP